VNSFDITIYISAVCGLVMVVGGIILLKTGAIQLGQAASSEAVAVEFLKFLKVQTRYPALGLFVIGLTFIIAAAIISKPAELAAITLKGKIAGLPDASGVTVQVSPVWGKFRPDSDGIINAMFHPDVQKIEIQIVGAGCDPPTTTKMLDLTRERVLSLSEVKLKRVQEKPPPAPEVPASADVKQQASENLQAKEMPRAIVMPPANVKLAPLQTDTTFN
jgi:hypothetical protein